MAGEGVELVPLLSLEYSPLSIFSVQASTWLTKLSRTLTKSW